MWMLAYDDDPVGENPAKTWMVTDASRICHGFHTVRISVLAQNPRGVFAVTKVKCLYNVCKLK